MGAQNGKMRPEPNREITNPAAPCLPSDALGDTLWAPAALVSLTLQLCVLWNPWSLDWASFPRGTCTAHISSISSVLRSPVQLRRYLQSLTQWLLPWAESDPASRGWPWRLSGTLVQTFTTSLLHITRPQNQTNVVNTKFSCQFQM